tara:strand:- start:241 stop:459 length:219 start_codon:yes stop_codon:yes gene_type:complete
MERRQIDWKKKAQFYKKQLDDIKRQRFDLQNEIKKKEMELEEQKKARITHYRKMTEFRNEVLFLINKKFIDI